MQCWHATVECGVHLHRWDFAELSVCLCQPCFTNWYRVRAQLLEWCIWTSCWWVFLLKEDWIQTVVKFCCQNAGHTQIFQGYVVGLAGLFVGLGEILGNIHIHTTAHIWKTKCMYWLFVTTILSFTGAHLKKFYRWCTLWHLWKIHQSVWKGPYCSSGIIGSLHNLSSCFLQFSSVSSIWKSQSRTITRQSFPSFQVCFCGYV